jgi:hypothetical protein
MAAGRIVLSQYFPARDRNGQLVPGALLYVYTNGTTTKASIYAEEALSTALANPVAANSSGQFPAIWASDAVSYTLSITAADGSSIGNPSVFDDYSVSTDADTASVALAEAAAAAAEVDADSAAADAAAVAADLAEILAIAASGDDAAAINARAAKAANGSDFADIPTVRTNLGVPSLVALALSTGSALIGWISAGTGAVLRTVSARLSDTVSAFDFIPVAEHAAIVAGTSTYNATSAIQAAINTGKTVEFPAGYYQAVGLTMSTNFQQLRGLGYVRIIKNGNGVILTASGINQELSGISFRGESATPTFTGDNVVLTGASPRMINCESRQAYGRAVKATGNSVQIWGSGGIYSTADVTATGYDIEIGVSGTATLYHELHGIYSSTATGGILLVDCGSQTIIGGQFGKLNISSGTSPAGVNGGKCVGARILGDVTVGISGANFAGNQFGVITFTINAGISGTHYALDNSEQTGFSFVNLGTVNQAILRHDPAGAAGYITLKYGPSSSVAKTQYDPASGDQYILGGNLYLPTDKRTYFGTTNKSIGQSSSNLQITNSDGALQYLSSAQHQFVVGSTVYGTVNTTGFLLPSGAALYNNSIKVVGAQGAAVADATDAASAITQLNALLARVRTHGLIAT